MISAERSAATPATAAINQRQHTLTTRGAANESNSHMVLKASTAIITGQKADGSSNSIRLHQNRMMLAMLET
jgi:hypothetical protein